MMLRLACWASLAVLATVALTGAQDDLRPGLLGEYYDIGEELDDFPSLAGRKPAHRQIDRQIEFKSTDDEFNGTRFKDRFFVRWTGILRVPEDGTYTFSTESDDGSRLFVEGKLAVDNGGLHSMHVMTGKVKLKAGNRAFRLDFFDNDRGAGCIVRWARGEDAPLPVPADALFHVRDKDLDR